MRLLRSPASYTVLLLSCLIQLGLLLYADHVDSHPEQFGGLKYTDIDWWVVSDGVGLIFHPQEGSLAQGWLVKQFDLRVGE
jgi:phosphatidylinositol glycan class M